MKIFKAILTFAIVIGIGYVVYVFFIFPLFFHYVKIVHVVDPDTIMVYDDKKVKIVQLIGVDAPEYNPEMDLHQCFDQQSLSIATNKYFSQNLEVQLVNDKTLGDKDPHGRYLRYIFLKNGDLLNEKLLQDGLARQFLMPYDMYQHQGRMEKAQIFAKDKRVGIWNPDGCGGKF